MSSLIDDWNKSHAKIPKNKTQSRYAEEKEKLFPKNAAVVDLGGGTGADTLFFLKHGHHVTLIDISDLALALSKDKAKAEGFSLTTMQADLTDLSIALPNDFAEIVYSRLALHYFDAATTIAIFKEVLRVLKPGGKALITVKSPLDEKEMSFLASTSKQIEDGVFSEDGKLKSRFTIEQLENILKNAEITNFEVKLYEEDMGGRVDKIKSGNKKQLFNEIIITK